MAWKVKSVMDQRVKFIAEVLEGSRSFAAICRRFGISRTTGYKWSKRYRESKLEGLLDRSRAPHSHPNAVDPVVEAEVLEMRRKHQDLGPRKIRHKLYEKDPHKRWPAASTIGKILDRNGLTVHRRQRHRASPSSRPLATPQRINEVWHVDFKGWFRTADGLRCEPLTLMESCSRYLLRCQAQRSTSLQLTKAVIKAAFKEYGLPEKILSDNGTPFASTGRAGLTRLNVWWIKLGIEPVRIQPGKPYQNGLQERFHLTLKQQVAPACSCRQQQRAFLRFQKYYNEQRPHQALDYQTPATLYHPSNRRYPDLVPDPDYPSSWLRRRVSKGGQFRFNGQKIFIAKALVGELIGLENLQDDSDRYFRVYFGPHPIGILDSFQYQLLHSRKEKRVLKELQNL